ncbi:DMT family transporter [Gordonia humi]|uniref:DMT family transporter n=1 Tax=Gordonia humi TaxID=686429 RepID=UPI003619008D
MSALSIVLAVLSAAFFAVAAVLQQKGTEGMSDDAAIGVGFVIALFQRKIWLAGLAANLAGFALQAGALAIGSLLLVQPFTVSTLLFALPLAAWTQKRRLQWREWMWAGVLVVGLVVFAVLGEPAAGITAPSFRAWILPLAVLAACAVLSMSRGARLPHGAQRSLVLALGAGVILGYSAPFTKTAMDALGDGLVRGLCSWELWAMIVASSVGTMWQQSSFSGGGRADVAAGGDRPQADGRDRDRSHDLSGASADRSCGRCRRGGRVVRDGRRRLRAQQAQRSAGAGGRRRDGTIARRRGTVRSVRSCPGARPCARCVV